MRKDNLTYISFYNALVKEAYDDLASLLHRDLPHISLNPHNGSSDGSATDGKKWEAVGEDSRGSIGCAVSVWEFMSAGREKKDVQSLLIVWELILILTEHLLSIKLSVVFCMLTLQTLTVEMPAPPLSILFCFV